MDPDSLRLVGCNYDDSTITPPDRMRYDAGFVMPSGLDPPGDLAIRDIPEGEVARRHYRGDIPGLVQCWGEFSRNWLPTSGWQPRTLFGFDLHPPGTLPLDRLDAPDLLSSQIESSLCIPVRPATGHPEPLWSGGTMLPRVAQKHRMRREKESP